MYNRYIPQDDGTYRKNQMPEPRQSSPRVLQPQQHLKQQPQQQEQEPHQQTSFAGAQEHTENVPPCRRDMSAGSFLRQLLPKNMDTGDLMIILLLLLMAGDCADDKNTALLTLALYLFM